MSPVDDAEVLDAALGAFRRRGLAEAEVYLENVVLESVTVTDGKVEAVENRAERGAGVRVLRDGRLGFAYSADVSPGAVDAMVGRAAAAAEHASAQESRRLPEPDAPPDLDKNRDPGLDAVPASAKVAVAVHMEEAARARDPRVRKTHESRYQYVRGAVHLARPGGYRYAFSFTRAFGLVSLVAGEGSQSQSGYHAEFALGPSGLDPEAIGRNAATKAIHKLGGAPCATGRAALLLAPDVVDGLLESLSPVFFAENALKGKSFLAGAVGERVAGERVTLVDDGRLPGGYGTAPIDGEGVATRRTVVLEHGILRGYLHDGFSAARMGVAPTGNALRESYMATPSTGTTALQLCPTGETRQEIIASVADGLLIEEVMGLHTINDVSGDFSVGALGRRVCRGVVGEPVAGIAVSGNVRQLLGAMVAVGDDLRLMPSGNVASSVLLEGIPVGGQGAT